MLEDIRGILWFLNLVDSYIFMGDLRLDGVVNEVLK